jgi:hypothetical protein
MKMKIAKPVTNSEMDKFYLEGFDKWLNVFGEANETKTPKEDDELLMQDMDKKEKEALKTPTDPKDAFKHVDEILKDVDLKVLTNEARKELIEIIIDSAQNSVEEDDDFDGFIEETKELIENYKTDDQTEDEEDAEKQENKKDKSAKEETKPEEQKVGSAKPQKSNEIPTGPASAEEDQQRPQNM